MVSTSKLLFATLFCLTFRAALTRGLGPVDQEEDSDESADGITETITEVSVTTEVAFDPFHTSSSTSTVTPSPEYLVEIVETTTQRSPLVMPFHTSESGGAVESYTEFPFSAAIAAPSEVQNLAAKSISDTKVTLQWDPPAHEDGVIIGNYSVSLKLTELRGCKDLNRCTPPEEEIVKIANGTVISFDGLRPYANYTVTAVAQTSKAGPPVTLSFETKSTVTPTSMVSNLRMSEDKGRVMWDKPADCTTITGPTKVARLYVTRVSDSALIKKVMTAYSYLNLSDLHLEPLSSYKVRVHVVRGYYEPENPDVYQELTWMTNLNDVEAPAVVNVTDSTAIIIQNVQNVGHAGQIYVNFILREVWSNHSFVLLPTRTTAVEQELHATNLKPNAHYMAYALVTILEYDRAVMPTSSPILFKTKCRDEPLFEVSPGEEDLTVHMPLGPEDCKPPANQSYSIRVYDTVENWLVSGFGFSQFPVTAEELNPDTEYKVEIWIRRQRKRLLIFTTNVRTTVSKVTVPEAN